MLDPGVTYLNGIWSSGWNESWKGLLVVTDVSTSWAEIILRLWRWLPLRMLNRLSPPTVIFWTHFTRTIKFHPRMLLVPWLKMIIRVIGVLRRTVVQTDFPTTWAEALLWVQWSFLVSWQFKNPDERFDWSIHWASLVNAWCDWLWRRVRKKVM